MQKDKKKVEKVVDIEPYWLNKKHMAASNRISTVAFDKWDVPQVAKIGRQAFYTVDDVVKNRVDNAAPKESKSTNPDAIDYDKERARLTKEQADAQELKNAVMRRELAPIELLEFALAEMSSVVSAIFESIPLKVKKRVPHLTASEVSIISREVIRAQNAASKTKLDWDKVDI